MIRGEVWTVEVPGQPTRWRVAVTGADGVPGAPWLVPIVRRAGITPPILAVELSDADPISGVALVASMARIPDAKPVEFIGILTGATLEKIGRAIRDMFDIP